MSPVSESVFSGFNFASSESVMLSADLCSETNKQMKPLFTLKASAKLTSTLQPKRLDNPLNVKRFCEAFITLGMRKIEVFSIVHSTYSDCSVFLNLNICNLTLKVCSSMVYLVHCNLWY